MKRKIIISVALILSIFLSTSCQKSKEPEGKKEVQEQQQQKEEVAQQPATLTAKEENSLEIKNSPLTEEEQRFVETGGQTFKNHLTMG